VFTRVTRRLKNRKIAYKHHSLFDANVPKVETLTLLSIERGETWLL